MENAKGQAINPKDKDPHTMILSCSSLFQLLYHYWLDQTRLGVLLVFARSLNSIAMQWGENLPVKSPVALNKVRNVAVGVYEPRGLDVRNGLSL